MDKANKSFKAMLSGLLLNKRRHARYIAGITCMALLVVFGVGLSLRQSGITLTRTETVLDCQYNGNGAHTHSESCYDADGNLVCPLQERPMHVHTPECYATERELACGLEETDGHQHGDECYDEEGNLTCTTPVGEGAHQHTDACYRDVQTDRLVCGLDEVTEQHVHTDACFRTVTIEEPDPELEPMATEPEPTADPEPAADPEPEPTPDPQPAVDTDPAPAVDPEPVPGTDPQPADPEPVDVVPTDPQPADPAAGQEPAEPAEPTYPKQEFDKRFLDADENEVLRVDVQAPEGALPEGTTMAAEWVDPASVQRPVERVVAAKDDAREVWYVQGVRITFYDRDGKRVQPTAGSRVTLTVTSSLVDTAEDAAVRPYVLRLQDDLHKEITTEEEDAARPAEVLERLTDEQLAAREVVLASNQLAFDAQYFCSDDFAESYLVAYTTERAQEPAADEPDEPADDQGDDPEDDGEPADDQVDDAEDEGDTPEGEDPADPGTDDPADPEDGDEPDSPEPADADDPEPSYPAQSFKHRFSDRSGNLVFRVEVEAPEGAFPEETSMVATWLDPSAVEGAVTDAVAQESFDKEVASIQAVDITFYDRENNPIEPRVPIVVTLTSDQIANESTESVLVHVDDAGAAEVVSQLDQDQLDEHEIAPADDQLVFESDAFSVYAIAYTIDYHGEILTTAGDTYEISVKYESDAKIPDNAELRVREITDEDDEYAQFKADVLATAENGIGPVPANPTLFDISIWANDEEIEPAEGSEVTVEVKLVDSAIASTYSNEDSPLLVNDAPLSTTAPELVQSVQVVHQVEEGVLEVMETTDRIDDGQVVSSFTTDSFSNWLVFLDQDVDEITVGPGDTITLRPYSQWEWLHQNTVDGQAVYWRTPDTGGHMSVETKSYRDDQLDQTYSYYQLTAQYNPGVFYIETTAGKRIKVTVTGQPMSDVPGTVQGLDSIKVNLFNYDLDHSLDVNHNVASWIDGVGSGWGSHYEDENGSNQNGPSTYATDGINAASALKFLGWGARNGNNRINNYDATHPTTDIVQSTLSAGTDGKLYPRLNGNGDTSLQYLFSPGNNDVDAYMNVTGLFRQDTDGYYYFNSNTNYAVYNNSSNSFTLYEHTYTQRTKRNNQSTPEENSKPIGFFPFHGYDSNNHLSPNHDTSLDHHFGLSMEVTFSLPEGKVLTKKDGTTEPIIFEFSGDDDMWVFVDNDLALDIGGIHQPLTGTIDFTNDDRFEAGKEYTLRIFYVERGGCDSNCSIRFNMPLTVGKGDVKIAKKRDKAGETTDTYLGGAVFGIWTNEECSGDPLKTLTSAETTGLAQVQNLPVNEPGQVYYMKEITPPVGYFKNDTIYTVTASTAPGADGKYTFTIRDKDDPDTVLETIAQEPYLNATVIKNEPAEPIDLTVEKLWKNADGSDAAAPEVTATFKVKRQMSYESQQSIQTARGYLKVYRANWNNNNTTPVQIGQTYEFEGNTSATVNWSFPGHYWSGYNRNLYRIGSTSGSDQYKGDSGASIYLPAGDTVEIYIFDGNYGTNYDGLENVTVNGTPPSETHTVNSYSGPDNDYNGPEIQLPHDGSWTYTFEDLPTSGMRTIEGQEVQCYYEYYLEEVGSTPGYQTIYTDGSGNVISGSDLPSHAIHVDGTQTITNRKDLEVPIEKYWPDFSGDQYTWTAEFQLQYREVKVDPNAENAADAQTTWADVEGATAEVSKEQVERSSFTGLTIYRTHSNGTEYRLIYSVRETSYTVRDTSDDSIVMQWNGTGNPEYTPQFEQDAGEDGADLSYYEIIVINTLANIEATEEINIGIQKTWPAGSGIEDDVNAQAHFELRRYVQTEYTDFTSAADLTKWVDITLVKGDGRTQTLHVPEGWQMSIIGNVKSGVNAGTITFGDGTSSTAVTFDGYDNSESAEPHEFVVTFVADRTKTITLTNGAEYILGGAAGLRLSDRNADDVEPAHADANFVEEFTLNSANDWYEMFSYLSSIEEDVHAEEATNITRHVYTYYFVETGSEPSNFDAIFKDSNGSLLGDDSHRISFTTGITAENKEKAGSLKITKKVMVDDVEASTLDGMRKNLADGTYTFKVYESDGTTEATKNDGTPVGPVTITITDGVATTVEVAGMTPGTYVIKEVDGDNASVLLDTEPYTVTVVSGVTGNDVPATGVAEVTNHYTSTGITAQKLWQTADGAEDTTKTGDITFTLIQTTFTFTEDGGDITVTGEVPGSEIAYTGPYTLKIGDAAAQDKVNASTITFASGQTAYITNLPKFGMLEGTPVLYAYSIRETAIAGYTGIETQDGEGNWTITNRPSAPTDVTTDLTVTKVWQDATGQPAELTGDENIQFTIKERCVKTEYLPVTITLYNPLSSTAVATKTVYVKKGTQFQYRLSVRTLLATHYANVSINGAATVTTAGNTTNTITVLGDSSITVVPNGLAMLTDEWAANPWTTPSSLPLYTWYFDYSGTADYKESYTDLLTLYQNTTEGSNVTEVTYVYDMTEDESTPETDAIGDVTTEDFVASFTNLPLFRKVGNEYCVYYYTIDEVKVNGETVHEGETSDYLVTVDEDTNTITNKQKPGALKIVKAVTVNGTPTTTTEADGVYTFKVFMADGETPAVDKDGAAVADQTIEIKNGVIYKVNDVEVDEAGRFALVGNLVPGDYVIQEVAPDNGVTLQSISGGKSVGDPDTGKVTVTVTSGDDGASQAAAAVTFTNNKVVDVNITILKVDSESGEPLTRAKFRLDQYDEGYHEVIKSWPEQAVSTVEGEEGTLQFEGLGAGYYKIVETENPPGYVRTFADPAFSVHVNPVTGLLEVSFTNTEGVTYNSDTWTFTVKNTRGTALPESGGPGTHLFGIFGSVLICAGLMYGITSRRKARKEVA